MIPLKAIFVISVLISGLMFTPSISFAQSNQDDSPFSSFFELIRQLFSFEDEPSEAITEFGNTTILHTGGSSSTSDTTEDNILPKANAGPDQTVLEFATVSLDGSSSTDVDGTIVSYHWFQSDGTTVNLSSLSDVNVTFTAPNVDSEEILKFNLTVTDNSGGSSNDDIEITVQEIDDDTNDDDTNDDDTNDDDTNDDDTNDDDTNDDDTNDDDTNDDENVNINTNNDKKVTICHVPLGNPNNSHIITVGESALNAHLAHGDRLGSCDEKLNNDEDGKEKNSNSGKGNKDKDDDNENKKGNSGKGNKDKDDDNENKKGNSRKGNSDVNNSNSGKDIRGQDDDDNDDDDEDD